jgi:putative phage-type endonuclease
MYNTIKKWNKIKQKTFEWYEERNKVITATNVSSILEINPYVSKYEVLQNKIEKNTIGIMNPATSWGEFHEPLAKKYYETMPLINGSRKIHEVGLIHHPIYNWLAASPDGVVECLENNINSDKKWWLLEIKCPYNREFKNKGHKTPSYIWVQIQIQLEVCDLPFCHLLQCKYVSNTNSLFSDKSSNTSQLEHKKITTILRDKEWFNNIALPKLIDFWNLILKSKQYNNFINPYPNPKEWVSLNSFTGFLLKDPIIDWLNMYSNSDIIKNISNKYPVVNNIYKNKIKDKINTFKSIIDQITKYGIENNKNVIYVSNIDEKFSEDLSVSKYEITKKALDDKIDIIIRPVLLDYKKKIYGIPDILMKNEVALNYLEKYPNTSSLNFLSTSDKNNYTIFSVTTKNNYPKNGLLSKWDNVLKNKYNGYATILNSITNNSQTLISLIGINTCILFEQETVDTNEYVKINDGVQWVRTLRKEGESWLKCITSDNIPTNRNIMPNMCNKFDQHWRHIKKELAEKWGELTLLWYCGIDQRNRAYDKGIYTWKNVNSLDVNSLDVNSLGVNSLGINSLGVNSLDVNSLGINSLGVNSLGINSLGVNSLDVNSLDVNTVTPDEIVMSLYANNNNYVNSFSNRKRIIKSMITLNRTPDKVYSSRNEGEITEPYIDTHNALEVYIDFETLPKKIINKNYSKKLRSRLDIIYLIGMKWVCKDTNTLKFKSFITDTLTLDAEKDMIIKWWDTVKKLKKETKSEKVILYHWSPAEERFLNSAFKRHSLSYIKNNLNSSYYELRDLMEMYVDAEVVIRNVWGYSIKDVAKGLNKNGLIPEVWDDTEKGGDTINSGEGTITTATNCYSEINRGISIHNNPNFTPLKEYNEMDCNVLYYLLNFLRNFVYSKDPRQKRKNDRSCKRDRCLDISENINNYKKKKFK